MPGPEAHLHSVDPLTETAGLIAPTGHDVTDPEEARTYLTDIHGIDPEEGYPKHELEIVTGYHIGHVLSGIDRAAITHPEQGERHQTVAEHSFNNINVALAVIHREKLEELNALRVVELLTVHDYLEGIAGDTVIVDEAHVESKVYREAAAKTLYNEVYSEYPEEQQRIMGLIEEYEEQETPEAVFAHAIDKTEPYLYAINTKAHTQISRGESFEYLVNAVIPKVATSQAVTGYLKSILEEVGRNWSEWGGEIDGEPSEIINSALASWQQDSEVEQAPAIESTFEAKTAHWGGQVAVLATVEAPASPYEGMPNVVDFEEARRRLRPEPTPTPPLPAAGVAIAV